MPTSVIAPAAIDATRPRNEETSPLPSGCTRLLRKTTNILLAGSIQIEVQVKPVWPNEPRGKRSPRLVEKLVLFSHPRPRVHPASETKRGRVISPTFSGDSIRTPL